VRALAAHFADLIPSGHSVLDVGCGDGLLDTLIMERRPDVRLSGVDVLVRPDAKIPVTPFDGRRLPFADRSWDSVMLCDVLHHTPDPVEALREAARVSRAFVILKDHTLEGPGARAILRLMDYVGNAPHGVALPYNYMTRAEWDAAFQSCGLVVTQLRRDLRLYPRWADPIFGGSLHFVACCQVVQEPPASA
jgi:SAM-dependent methyltransferase